jgi:replicative DNA helicase
MPLLSTGLPAVDKLIGGGFLQNEYGIIAAGPGGGKTGLAVQIIYYNARQGKSGLYFSFEVSRREIQARLIALHIWFTKRLRIPFSAILKRTLSAEHRAMAEEAWKDLCMRFKITIVDDASLTPAQVQASAIRVLHGSGLDLIVCDQLQHMKDGSGMSRAGNERQIVSSISAQLRELPKELGKHKGCDGVPVIALSRLSRDGYDEPTMAHLKESGDIESDAHWITLLWQQDKSQQSGDPAQAKVWLKVEKCRNGASGVKVALDYDKSTNHLR